MVFTLEHDSGAKSDTNPGYLYADDGTPIPSYRNLPKGRGKNHDPRLKSSCHGTTFADDKYWINNEDAQKVLDGDGYKRVGPPFLPKPGDVVIYRDDKTQDIVHSGTVKSTGGEVRVWGHGGVLPNATKPIGPGPGTFWEPPATVEIYRK